MQSNAFFAEYANVIAAVVPVNLATGDNLGQWVSMKRYMRLVVLAFKGIGTGGDDPVFTITQAKDVSGTGSKALNFTQLWKKVNATVTGVGQFTNVTQAAANTYTATGDANKGAIYMFEFKQEDLDGDNGFTCVQVDLAKVGTNSQLGCMLYLTLDARDAKATPDSPIPASGF